MFIIKIRDIINQYKHLLKISYLNNLFLMPTTMKACSIKYIKKEKNEEN